MGKLKRQVDRYQEDRVRIAWDRHDVYDALRVLVRGSRRIHQRRVAFLDREDGVLATVPSIVDRVVFVPWPRSRNAVHLAQLAMSADATDRQAALAVLATTHSGTTIDLEREATVYFLTSPEDPETEHLSDSLPLGNVELTRGQVNWTVAWDDLERASSCSDLTTDQEGDITDEDQDA